MSLTTTNSLGRLSEDIITAPGERKDDENNMVTNAVVTNAELNHLFQSLCSKYSVTVPKHWRLDLAASPAVSGEVLLVPAGNRLSEGQVPLFVWRKERRFVEHKKLVCGRTVDDVVMCRFSCTGSRAGESLARILFREYDLLEWINDAAITDLYASMYDGIFANVVAGITTGAIGSIEVGSTLPRSNGQQCLDRHELIARRGVASDRVVDSQIPQQSIYLFTEQKRAEWTDCDAELFGLPDNVIYLIRAAFDLARTVADDPSREKTIFAELRQNARRLDRLVTLTFDSARDRCALKNLDSITDEDKITGEDKMSNHGKNEALRNAQIRTGGAL